MPKLDKKEWILAFLAQAPLDRIKLVKGLFLLWYRSGRHIPGYFEFAPYLYGPFCFELYPLLSEALRDGLISQAPHWMPNWAPYYLTERGSVAAAAIAQRLGDEATELVRSIAAEVASLGFHDLLRRVYAEAPDFAAETVVSATRP